MKLNLDDHFNVELPADTDKSNRRRQVHDAAFSPVTPRVPTAPRLLHVAPDVAELIGLSADDVDSTEFLETFSGTRVPAGARPYAMCYGGHQFGNWAGQLGDGRAINLAEVSHAGKRWTLQLKGAGETPYSRTADGLAVLRSSLREHLCSEAMHHLGVPTTRSLSLITTGDSVMRDVMYDGNSANEPGAVVCRVAASFIRFGNFQIFASRGDIDSLRRLTDYTIKHYFPTIDGNDDRYSQFFAEVARRTVDMVVGWQRVGFVHGVMNTDNMSIHGETIDYGPYGWLEGYAHDWTPNTTDAGQGRYRFGNQPQIVFWNLVQLANAIYPLTENAEPLQDALNQAVQQYEQSYDMMLSSKIGLDSIREGDTAFLADLESTLQLTETDMTIFFRLLAKVPAEHLIDEGSEFLSPVMDAFYKPEELTGETLQRWRSWFQRYVHRVRETTATDEERASRMNSVNPKYVLRNYMAQLAIDKADRGDPSLIDELYEMLRHPYDEQPNNEKWFAKRPDWARHKVGCSMLSCSS
ncbi:MAG: YdiU family protein [Rubripirellula sp.]